MRRFLVVLAVCLLLPAARAQPTFTPSGLADAIAEVLAHGDFRDATWGALVVDVASGRRLYAHNEYQRFIPASNIKLFTTAAVLDALGPDFRYTTRLYADGPVHGGALYGGLVVRGGGDPTFEGHYTGGDLMLTFRQWADSLAAHGIRRVAGPAPRDETVFPHDGAGLGARRHGAGAGTVAAALTAGEALPAAPRATDPFVRTLVAVLRQQGIEVAESDVLVDAWGERPAYGRMARVATFRSPPMSAIVGVVNDDSNNLYAETLMRTLGAYEYSPRTHGGAFARGSFEAGVAAAEPFYRRLGVDPATITLADGSGLSRANRLTPEAVVALLVGMHDHRDTRVWDTFLRSLPLGGYTGTLRNRYDHGDARGNVRAKTGFINRARTLSGYVTDANGRLLAFSLLCNHYSTRTSRVNRAQDAVVELLADYEGR